MAIEATHLTDSLDEVDRTVYTTASISPTANRLILATFCTTKSDSHAGAPTLAGNGLTWVEVNHVQYTPYSQFAQITVFRAMGSSPSSGTLAATFPEETLVCQWSVTEFANIDTGGTNGSAAVVQSATQIETSQVTTSTVTLSSFGSVNNATYGTYTTVIDDNLVDPVGYTEFSNNKDDFMVLGCSFLASNDTSPTWTKVSTNQEMAGVALEIKAADEGSTQAAGTAGRLAFPF